MNPKGNIKLCGQVCSIPGRHKDWICHQPATKRTGRCLSHSPKTDIAGRPDELYKRASLIRELGLHKDFGDHRNDPELLELKNELTLIDIRIDAIMRLLKGENTIENDKRLIDLLKVRRQYVESIYKTTADGVPKERVVTFIYAMMNITFKYITDPRQKAEYLAAIREISGRRADAVTVPDIAPIDMTPPSAPEPPPEVIDAPA